MVDKGITAMQLGEDDEASGCDLEVKHWAIAAKASSSLKQVIERLGM